MGKIRSYRDLHVWQRAMELSRACFDLIERSPRRATRGIAGQLLRAADSISDLIAEGHGRPSRRDYLHYVGMALGSVREVDSQLEKLRSSRGLYGPRLSLAFSLNDECGRMLNKLQQRLRET